MVSCLLTLNDSLPVSLIIPLSETLMCWMCAWWTGQILVHSFWLEHRSVSQLTCRRWQGHGPTVSSWTLSIPHCLSPEEAVQIVFVWVTDKGAYFLTTLCSRTHWTKMFSLLFLKLLMERWSLCGCGAVQSWRRSFVGQPRRLVQHQLKNESKLISCVFTRFTCLLEFLTSI